MYSFTSDRLFIKPLAEEDKALFISLYTNAKIMGYITKPLSSERAEKAFYNTLRMMTKSQPRIMTWAIVSSANNETIGIQGLTWPKKKKPVSSVKEKGAATQKGIKQVELGIIISTKYQGMGFAQEAITVLLNYGFNYILLDRVNVFYVSQNLASKQLFDKLNFIYDMSPNNPAPERSYQYIDRQDWLAKIYLPQ